MVSERSSKTSLRSDVPHVTPDFQTVRLEKELERDLEKEDLEKDPEVDEDGVSATAKEATGVPLEPVESSTYATGLKLATIVIAVILSIFLVALDMTIVATVCLPDMTQLNSLR